MLRIIGALVPPSGIIAVEIEDVVAKHVVGRTLDAPNGDEGFVKAKVERSLNERQVPIVS